MTNIKAYDSTIEGKRDFVKEVLSPLMRQAMTGWYGAEYEQTPDGREWVYLLNSFGTRSKRIEVSANSNLAIVLEVFNNL